MLERTSLIDTVLQKKIGILPKDSSSGPFVDEWKKVYSELKDVEEVDIAPALSAALAVKDENELVRNYAQVKGLNDQLLIH